jgi:hypothetical protein
LIVQVNTDSNIEGTDELLRELEAVVRDAVDRFSDQLTRMEVHLSDENSTVKGGAGDMRCLLEARLAGRAPIVVSHQAATVEQATEGAAAKMKSSLDSALGKLGRR